MSSCPRKNSLYMFHHWYAPLLCICIFPACLMVIDLTVIILPTVCYFFFCFNIVGHWVPKTLCKTLSSSYLQCSIIWIPKYLTSVTDSNSIFIRWFTSSLLSFPPPNLGLVIRERFVIIHVISLHTSWVLGLQGCNSPAMLII